MTEQKENSLRLCDSIIENYLTEDNVVSKFFRMKKDYATKTICNLTQGNVQLRKERPINLIHARRKELSGITKGF